LTINKSETSKYTVYGVLLLICWIWGGAFASIKYLLAYVSPLQLVKIRYIIATPFFITILLFKDWKNSRDLVLKNPIRFLTASLFGVIGYNLALAAGEMKVPSGTASIIINLSPVFILILSILLLGEHFSLSRLLGMILSLSGLIVLIQSGKSGDEISWNYYGYVLITILAPVSWAIYTIACKPLTEKYDSITITGLTITAGTIPLILLINRSDINCLKEIPGIGWTLIIYLSLGCTAVGYSAWNWALKRLPSSTVASFVYIIPVFALMNGVIFMKEPLTGGMLIGAVTLLCGVYIVNRSKKPGK
jgi:drug/metabolite transporter (DMT)-like permease